MDLIPFKKALFHSSTVKRNAHLKTEGLPFVRCSSLLFSLRQNSNGIRGLAVYTGGRDACIVSGKNPDTMGKGPMAGPIDQ